MRLQAKQKYSLMFGFLLLMVGYCDLANARYLQSDPIGVLKSFNDPQMKVAMHQGVPLSNAIGVYGELNHTYGYVGGNPVNLYDPFGLFSYNKPPPATVPVSDELAVKVSCLEQCMGMSNMIVTGGAETSGHNAGSKHYTGQAVDVGFRSNPDIFSKKDKFFCCAGKCGFEYGQIEGNHFHIQEVSGKNGGRGDIPQKGECNECK